jgi:glutathione S-transferase
LREAGLDAELVKIDTKTHKLADGSDYYEYLADRNPASGLAPAAGTMERYRLVEWLNFITSELHKQFSPLFAATTPAEYKSIVRERIAKRFDWISGELKGKDYLMGKRFTVADAYLFTILNWTKSTGIELAKWPVLAGYHARVAARPKVQEAMIAEGLIKPAPAPVV